MRLHGIQRESRPELGLIADADTGDPIVFLSETLAKKEVDKLDDDLGKCDHYVTSFDTRD